MAVNMTVGSYSIHSIFVQLKSCHRDEVVKMYWKTHRWTSSCRTWVHDLKFNLCSLARAVWWYRQLVRLVNWFRLNFGTIRCFSFFQAKTRHYLEWTCPILDQVDSMRLAYPWCTWFHLICCLSSAPCFGMFVCSAIAACVSCSNWTCTLFLFSRI